MKLSICIPTYNRADNLVNCLNSIALNMGRSEVDFEVCISDNGSTDHTGQVVLNAKKKLDIKYQKNQENVGRVRNYLKVVEMADGKFVWLLGDDDLLLPDAIAKIGALINTHNHVDFFYINSFHLTTEYVAAFPQPFDTVNLPKDMKPFSSWGESGEMPFMDLVNPKISFDFLGGMFLAVFRRRNWLEHARKLDKAAISDPREFSHYDNTFPHVKIFSSAFAQSKAYFQAEPLSVNLMGTREWAPMSPLVQSVRLIESLYEFRKNGLPYFQYLRCKNFALGNFIPDFVKMLMDRSNSGVVYIKPLRLIIQNCVYPNFYLSPFYYCVKKLKRSITKNRHSPEVDVIGSKKEVKYEK